MNWVRFGAAPADAVNPVTAGSYVHAAELAAALRRVAEWAESEHPAGTAGADALRELADDLDTFEDAAPTATAYGLL